MQYPCQNLLPESIWSSPYTYLKSVDLWETQGLQEHVKWHHRDTIDKYKMVKYHFLEQMKNIQGICKLKSLKGHISQMQFVDLVWKLFWTNQT